MGANMRARASIVKGESLTEAPPRLFGDGAHDDSEAVCWYLLHHVPLPAGGRYLVYGETMCRLLPANFGFGLGTA